MSSSKKQLTASDQQEAEQKRNTLIYEDADEYGWIQLNKRVIFARNLSPQAVRLYLILKSYAYQKNHSFPSYETLCKDLQVKRDAVRRYMQELEAANLIEQRRRGLGLTNVYILKSIKSARLEVPLEHLPEIEIEADAVKTRHQEDAKTRHPNGVQTRHKEIKVEETKRNKEKTSRKASALKTKKEREASAPPTRSHIANGAIGNGEVTNTVGTKTRKINGEASKVQTATLTKPPITQDEIDQNRAQGRNASGFTHIGVSLEHMDILNRQFSANSPPGSNGQRQPAANGKQGQWRSVPSFIQFIIADWFSLELHDQAAHSTITSVHKIFLAWLEKKGLQFNPKEEEGSRTIEEEFRNLLIEAHARSKRATITKRTPDGRPNRTPFFKACLENLCGLREQTAGEQLPAPPPN